MAFVFSVIALIICGWFYLLVAKVKKKVLIMHFFPFFSFFVPYFQRRNKVENPRLLHHWSIAAPSILHRIDGLTMEQRWSSDGAASEEEPCFFHVSGNCQTNVRQKKWHLSVWSLILQAKR